MAAPVIALSLAVAAALLALLTGGAAARRPDNPWGEVLEPAPGEPEAIGGYSGGCIRGAATLPLDGPGYQVMHPSRRRHYGHPHLVDFIRKLARGYHEAGHGVLLIGDLAQPRGGKAHGGHASHQTGLDVDIWYWHPPRALEGPLPTEARENLRSHSILDGKKGEIRKRWKQPVATALELSARDPRVQRIFVHPIIKRELCQRTEGQERGWLRALRPWWGHDDHFHVRLRCPEGSPECEPQHPVGEGDGCQELSWWFDAEAQAERKKERSRYRRKVVSKRRWPEACDALLP
ncbi:MAG: penicillin-insensitive murein endopeptidase [Myxococcales bacterium]|jgi:penicillin-insensitive murein endopeptidase